MVLLKNSFAKSSVSLIVGNLNSAIHGMITKHTPNIPYITRRIAAKGQFFVPFFITCSSTSAVPCIDPQKANVHRAPCQRPAITMVKKILNSDQSLPSSPAFK